MLTTDDLKTGKGKETISMSKVNWCIVWFGFSGSAFQMPMSLRTT